MKTEEEYFLYILSAHSCRNAVVMGQDCRFLLETVQPKNSVRMSDEKQIIHL